MSVEPETRATILAATKEALLETGYANLSTRKIAETAGVPLSQIHYHFGSKQNLVLALLSAENERLLRRQASMYKADMPLWKRWEQAVDFLEDDLSSGYVRVLQEMAAAGWSNEAIATAVRADLRGWFDLLTGVASEPAVDTGSFTPQHVAALTGAAFLGAEEMILLGYTEEQFPVRAALRAVGNLIRVMEESGES